MTHLFLNEGAPPGPEAALESAERTFSWGPARNLIWFPRSAVIDGASRDGGNTSLTTTLRPGLILGRVTSGGKFKQYDPTATDGTEIPFGILAISVKVVDADGANRDRHAPIVVAGPVKSGQLISGLSPYTLDNYARSQMRPRFWFDDDFSGGGHAWFPWRREIAKTADYTVTAADNGTLFTTFGASGAVAFTLPTLARGLYFGFSAQANQNLTVASAGSADDIIAFNDLSADSVAFSTASEKIGGLFRVYANVAATKWIVENVSAGANTVTVA